MKQLLVLCLAFTLFACDNLRVFEAFHDFPNKKWSAKESANFTFEIPNASVNYNLYYSIRNTLSYPYYNLYIRYELLDPEGKIIKNEMIDNNLMHPQTGEPLGSGSGDLFDNQFSIASNYQFPKVGKYEIRIYQYMRLEELPEVLAVGVRVEKIEN